MRRVDWLHVAEVDSANAKSSEEGLLDLSVENFWGFLELLDSPILLLERKVVIWNVVLDFTHKLKELVKVRSHFSESRWVIDTILQKSYSFSGSVLLF